MNFKLMPFKHIAAAMMLGFVTISSWAAPVPAEKPFGFDQAEILSVARKVADWQIKECRQGTHRMDSRCSLSRNV